MATWSPGWMSRPGFGDARQSSPRINTLWPPLDVTDRPQRSLRMPRGVEVDLARAGQQEPCPLRLRQPQRIVRPQRADFQRRNRMPQVIDRAGRGREVQDVVERPVDLQRMRDVVADEGETG